MFGNMFGTRGAGSTATAGSTASGSSPSRMAPRSSIEALKPQAAPPPPIRMRRPRGGVLSMMSGLLTFGLVISGVLTFGLLLLGRAVEAPGPLASDKTILIPKGTGISEIAEILTREGVIANPTLFELYANLNRSKGNLKAGEFLFKANVDVSEAIDTLIQGRALLHSVTIPEGLTSEQIVARLRENDTLTGDVREVPREGSLLPDTYKFERGQTRQQVVNQMQTFQKEALAKAWAKRSPDLAIRTPQELVILASIVEKETGKGDERARVAGVFVNRLAKRMKLQSDPTIVYGIVGGKGTLGRGILKSEIERATPYNTYAIEGLPPGPIANPGRAALEAAASPAKTRDLFFVADGSGGHAFAETYEQHLRNVARWRQVERSREAAAPAGAQVDRAEPSGGPENRSDLLGASAAARAAAANVDGSPDGRGPGRGGFDAVEGTARDPLRNQSWDLSSAKTVPAIAPEPGAARAAAPAQPQPRKPQPQPRPRERQAAP